MLPLMLLLGCDTTVSFSIDASTLADRYGDAILYANLVHYGELDEAVVLDLQAGEYQLTLDTELEVGIEYGVVAYADVNRDGVCEPAPVDPPWLFIYLPGVGIDYVWQPDPGESPEASDACSWFSPTDGPPDPEPL